MESFDIFGIVHHTPGVQHSLEEHSTQHFICQCIGIFKDPSIRETFLVDFCCYKPCRRKIQKPAIWILLCRKAKKEKSTRICLIWLIYIFTDNFQNLSISSLSFHFLEIGKECVASPFPLTAAPAPQGLNLLSEDVNYVRGDIFSPNPQ